MAAEYDLEHDVAARQDRFAKLRELTRSALPDHLPAELTKEGFVNREDRSQKPNRGANSKQGQ